MALVLLHSLHAIPEAAQPPLGNVSRACLVVAIAALGLKTSFQTLFEAGWRPFALLAIETAWLAAAMLGCAIALRG
jgi:uncharacterized membrane protein YadS